MVFAQSAPKQEKSFFNLKKAKKSEVKQKK